MPQPTELYLKYRPTRFDQLIGESQREAARTFEGLFDIGLPPRWVLLSGPPGVGKTTMARIIARCFLCDAGPTSTPCGRCSFCRTGHSPNFVEINAATSRGAKDIGYIVDSMWYPLLGGRFRVVIVDEADALNRKSAAALRTILDDPPLHAVFVLCTNDFLALPQSLRSRCHNFKFEKISFSEMVWFLRKIAKEEGANLSTGQLQAIARLANGQPRDALNGLERALVT